MPVAKTDLDKMTGLVNILIDNGQLKKRYRTFSLRIGNNELGTNTPPDNGCVSQQ